MSALDAVLRRRSFPAVTDAAPSHEQLVPLVAAAASVADHGAMRPWRLIELRGDARASLGEAMVAASGASGVNAERMAAKPLRASLLIAVVACTRPNVKVAGWEQVAVASGVAHVLSLLLDEAGWGVMWRTGPLTRSAAVGELHGLVEGEELLGWLYVGGKTDVENADRKPRVGGEEFLSSL